MNISTGGPHILFFERDQQLTALLTSEFQLAGYECHAARTAVEVFDTIARFPVRILLVNLAQAAAGRREFWVALDTQRRGRGVQVFTYLCSNLAGYGPRDVDDRTQGQLADIEIDGMLGLMNLVDAVRERVPGPTSTSSTSTQTRLPRTAPPATPPASTATAPIPTSGTTYRTGSIADTPRTATLTAPVATQAPPPVQQSYSEKIRAVLYPTQRSTNLQAPAVHTDAIQSPQETERQAAYRYDTQQNVPQNEQRGQSTQPYDADATTLQRLAYGQPTGERESGLDQLSRLLQERSTPVTTESTNRFTNQAANDVAENRYAPSTLQTTQQGPSINYAPATQSAQSTDTIGTQPLRASPIEDLPLDRATNAAGTNDGTRRTADGTARTNYGQHSGNVTQNTPLASITTLRQATPPSTAKATMPMPVVIPPQPVETPSVQEQRVTHTIQPAQHEEEIVQQAVQETPVAFDARSNDRVRTDDLSIIEQQVVDEEEEHDEVTTAPTVREQHMQQEQVPTQEIPQEMPKEQDILASGMSPNNAMLLDIVQSLPLMPSPPPQSPSQAVSGRTMRTLGSVLLEGHLVPQSRLEVAQNIQRMLRGVDLNYQLGEILLMFKLLTPDQLLAASLVSYGMISTQQISALGRIRQELHAVGLEYDLESLLILFRMLTPEQLREVRTSWQG